MPEIPRKDRALGLTQKNTVSGPITAYDPVLARRVLEAIASGATRKQISADPSLPSFDTFIRWALLDENLRKAWKEARQISAYMFEDEALDKARILADDDLAGGYSSARVRAIEVAMQQWNKSAAIRDKAEFGEKSQQNNFVPVQINTTLDLGNGLTAHMPATTNVTNPFSYEITPSAQKVEDATFEELIPEHIEDNGPVPGELSTEGLGAKIKLGPKPKTPQNKSRVAWLQPKHKPATKRPRKSRVSEVFDK